MCSTRRYRPQLKPLESDMFDAIAKNTLVPLWTQVVTDMEIDEHRAIRVLDAKTWQQRLRRLETLGGQPIP